MAIVAGIFIAVGSWAPLWIVEAYDRYAMPVGLLRLMIHVARASW